MKLVISSSWMKLVISNLVCRLNARSTGITHVKVLQYGVHLSHVISKNFGKEVLISQKRCKVDI